MEPVKSGSILDIDGHQIVVTCIRTQETIEGRTVVITAMDQESARKAQLEMLHQDQVTEDSLSALRGLMDRVKKELPELFRPAPPPSEG